MMIETTMRRGFFSASIPRNSRRSIVHVIAGKRVAFKVKSLSLGFKGMQTQLLKCKCLAKTLLKARGLRVFRGLFVQNKHVMLIDF